MLSTLKIPDYTEFLTLPELDKAAHINAKKYNFSLEQIGTSELGHSIYLITAGRGPKKVFLWGFPHPNEPVGSLLIDAMLSHVGTHPELQKKYTWYCIYTADPDGTKLNESWFKGQLTLEKYFRGFYRQGASRMIDWNFPIKYKEFEWNKPLKETQTLVKLLNKVKPDVMYPLHNSGFSGAYFLATRKFSKAYYETIRKATVRAGIPLHEGDAEELFMIEIEKPFYYDFGFKEYYEQTTKLGKDPTKVLLHGDNSTGYLTSIKPEAVTIKTEVPYFYSKDIADIRPSGRTLRDNWLEFIKTSRVHLDKVQSIIEQALPKLDKTSPWHYKLEGYKSEWEKRSDHFKNYVSTDPSFEKPASKADTFNGLLGAYFYNGGTLFGQVRRAALEANLPQKIIQELEKEIKHCSDKISEATQWRTIPIKNLVELQAKVLNETLKELES